MEDKTLNQKKEGCGEYRMGRNNNAWLRSRFSNEEAEDMQSKSHFVSSAMLKESKFGMPKPPSVT